MYYDLFFRRCLLLFHQNDGLSSSWIQSQPCWNVRFRWCIRCSYLLSEHSLLRLFVDPHVACMRTIILRINAYTLTSPLSRSTGTDYRNIQDLVNATTLVYNGWTINSGCEYNGVAPPGTALWKDDVPSSIANSNSNNNNKNHNNNHNSNDNNNKNKAEEQQYQLHYTPIRFQL